MSGEEIDEVLSLQRKYFDEGKTLDIGERIRNLKLLHKAIKENEGVLLEALREDLGKSSSEAYMCEVGLALSEISHMIKHARRYARKRRAHSPLANFCSSSRIEMMPYGTVLILSPWNYPVLLLLDPLTDALAAGNTCVVKGSAYSPKTSETLARILEETFPRELVCPIRGGREENSMLFEKSFDYIFFTGSKNVGRVVLEKAAKHLTPVTLELGGKSPCIIDEGANLKLAARRLAWGKFLNCGQTCVAPDYVLIDRKVKDKFIPLLEDEIERQFGKRPLENPDYGKIISEKHYRRILGLIDRGKVVFGGESDDGSLRISPTIMDGVTAEDKIMSEEIFGPVLPMIAYDDFSEADKVIRGMDRPLAFYVFSKPSKAKGIMARYRFGGGAINDTVIHLIPSSLPFGGMGESGMGTYHGKFGFETFSHMKSVVEKRNFIDLPLRSQPFRKWKDSVVRLFLH